MAEKLQYIEELAEKTLKELSKHENWFSYLKTASNHYKYSFRDSYLIHAQNPDATAVAGYELWNSVMHRYVNKGSKGIALIDRKQGKPRLHYVFDISDTNGDRMPNIWQLRDEYHDRINQEIADSFDMKADPAFFSSTIDTVVDSLIEDNMPELLSELKYSKEDSFLEELDDLNLEVMLRQTLKASINATVLLRCGEEFDLDDFDYEFSHLQNFNTDETMILLGTATSDISETILREIEMSVKTIERKQRRERSLQNGNQLQGKGRDDVPRPENQRTDRRTADEVRNDEEGLSGEEPREQIQPNDTQRDTVPPLQTSGDGSQAADGITDRADEEIVAAEPLADGNSGNRESADTGNDNSEINEQADIDHVLLSGSGFEGGKQRVINYYFEEHTNTERAAFLKDEYGVGGGTVVYENDRRGYQDYNAKGIDIHNNGFDNPSIHLTWVKTAKQIGELIESERYYKQRYPNEKSLIKPIITDDIETQGADEQAPFSFVGNDLNRILNDNITDINRTVFENQMLINALESSDEENALYEVRTQMEAYFNDTALIDIKPDLFMAYHNNPEFGEMVFERLAEGVKQYYISEKETEKLLVPKGQRRTQPEMNFIKLEKLAPHIMDKRYSYAKLKSDGFMDLSIEWIDDKTIAIAHYGEQNGDLMADPDMELMVDFDKKTIMPATFQNDYAGLYQEVYSDNNQWKPKLSRELTSFLSTWLKNIEYQGHVLRYAKYYQDEPQSTPIALNDIGLEYGFDIPHDIISISQLEPYKTEHAEKEDIEKPTVIKNIEPQYELVFGEIGNGITVWNRLVEVDGDYQNIAHIGEDGTITYHIDDLSSDVIEKIEEMAAPILSDKLREMHEHGYKWDGMNNLDDEEALKLFDAGHDIYLLHDDNTESLCESEKRLLQHINDGGLVGIEKDRAPIHEITENQEKGAAEAPFLMDDGAYKPLFEAIIMQGNINVTGKTKIANLVNESPDMETLLADLKDLYGDFWSQVKFNDETIRWHITPKGLDVFINGFDQPKLHYTWDEISSTIIDLVNLNTYFAQTELPQSRLHKGMLVELNDRKYKVESLDILNNKIELADITFAQGTGFPIFRKEYLRSFEIELENAGFFNEPSKEEIQIEPKEETPQTEKTNFNITDDNLGVGGAKEKYQRNITAIKLLKIIENDERLATSEEQEILSQYVGWGGLAKAFDETDNSWSGEYAELKGLLDETEYKTARASTLNAHYTSPIVIKAMYKALENMGFSGGNILEPAMGIGNFMGLLPPSLSNSNMYGVELDSISGRIAKQLYQRENIQVTGLEHTAFHDNFFDVAIGNIPFGSYGVIDKRYDKHNFVIHDYFFAKTLDKVRPGGIVAFITSKGTLDKKNSNVRRYLAQRAELIGAIRLPNNAFKANAGTEVTSDIIFLKKRDSLQDIEPDWVQLGQTWDRLPINQYFADNPHMILGTMKERIGMYGAKEIACIPFEGKNLEEQLSEAITYIHAEIEEVEYMVDEPDTEDTSIPANPNVKNYSFTLVDDKLYYRENSRMNLVETNAKAEKRIKAMLGLSKTLHLLIDYQLEGYAPHAIENMQIRLNGQYDSFIKEFGRINDRANSRAFSDDSSYYLLSSLEAFDDDGNFESKADIFNKQTIRPRKIITHVDTSTESLTVSIANKAKVDIGYMSSLTGKEPETITEDLQGIIFKNPLSDLDNPYEGYEAADEYLSGDVRDKLRTVKLIAQSRPEFASHVPALEAIQPTDLEAGDIEVRLGTVWIPTDYVESFMFELLDTSYYGKGSIEVQYSKHSGSWYVSNKSYDSSNLMARETYGTSRINAYQIIEETLNQKNVRITDRVIHPDGREEYVLNKKETLLASQKQILIREAFKDWIFKDESRRKYLVDHYNENYNNIRPREYNGEHLEFIGMNPEIILHDHQKNAIARQLYGGNALLAHVVGAGKTFTMVAAAMESKRLGLSTKNMITVPNHLTQQLAAETLRLYPSAKVLVTTKKDFQKHNRKRFCSKIATGDYDIVIIGHSQFEKVPLSFERQIRMIENEIFEITNAIDNAHWSDRRSHNVKQLEKTKKTLEKRLEKLNDQSRKDDVVTFEQLGIDRLFVDEAHSFKNLFVYTKMRNVAGIQQTQAQKAMDMYMKCKYLDEITGGKGITFATGTPISNSMVEMYTMQRYLQMHELEKRDLHHFDNWASVFGETQTAYELAPEGNKFRIKTRFSKFYNLPELMSMFKNVADIQTNDMLNLPIPKLKSGKIINISVPASDIQKKMIAELGERADRVRNNEVEPTEDNMLCITNDGRKIALDQRLANPCYPDDADSKINTLMRNVYDIWQKETPNKGAQIVFCDLSTPKFNGEFSIYEDLRQKWIDKGVPAKQIAFIHEAKNEKQKAAMFAKVRSGEIRIILGSTFMLGSGVNIQNRLKAVHHADVGWKPSSMEQRNGRILRQGNGYDEVEIYRYITDNTFDAYNYQILEQKQRFIAQIMTSKAPVRSADDIDEAVLSYAEVKALATGNPLIKERMELEVDVSRLKLFKTGHKNQIYRLQDQISTRLPEKIKSIELRIAGYEADCLAAAFFDGKDFSMTLSGTVYTEKKDAGEMLLALSKQSHQISGKVIGEYKGFKFSIHEDSLFKTAPYIELKGEITHRIDLGSDAFGNLTRIDNVIKDFSQQIEHKKHDLDSAISQLENAKREVDKPFEQEFELKQKTTRLNELNHELSMDKKDEAIDIADDEQPENEKAVGMER